MYSGREVKDLRCIVFVERIITAIVLKNLLNELLPELIGWKAAYTAGSNSWTQSQSKKEQSTTIEDFRDGRVSFVLPSFIMAPDSYI